MIGRHREIVVEPARRLGERVEAAVRVGRERRVVSFVTRDHEPPPLDDAFVPVALLLGMKTGRRVRLEGPVGEPVLSSLEAVAADLRTWYPRLRAPRVVASEARAVPSVEREAAATFFSGGLDSFYTAIVHAAELTHLVFVHGFDLRLPATSLRGEVAARVRQASEMLGKAFVEIETDLRDLSDRHANWAWFSHAGLAAVALLLAPDFREILIPATLADAHRPEALRGRADRETWRASGAKVRSDGAEATRPEKARVVAEHEAARTHLRVCWENREGAYNCGRCDKCLRTLVGLEAAGVRERFTSFPPTFTLEAVRRLRPTTRSDRQLLDECRWMAEARKADPALIAALARIRSQAPGNP